MKILFLIKLNHNKFKLNEMGEKLENIQTIL